MALFFAIGIKVDQSGSFGGSFLSKKDLSCEIGFTPCDRPSSQAVSKARPRPALNPGSGHSNSGMPPKSRCWLQSQPEGLAETLMIRRLLQLATVMLVLAGQIGPVSADVDDVVTLGVGAGMVYTAAPGQVDVSATAVHFNLRAKVLYFLGVDLMLSPGASNFESGQPKPRFRLSGLLYPITSRYFSFFLSGGMMASDFGDIIDFNAPTTYARAGGGFEFTFDGHYSLGIEGYWFVPGLGVVNGTLNNSLSETGQLPTLTDAVPIDGYEVVVALRYFF